MVVRKGLHVLSVSLPLLPSKSEPNKTKPEILIFVIIILKKGLQKKVFWLLKGSVTQRQLSQLRSLLF